MKIKILSYNIHKGFTITNRAFILREIRDAIRKTGADILFLQEVLGDHYHDRCKIPDWESSIQFEYLADEAWTHFAYGQNAIYPDGHHGNAILSKFPITSWDNLDISTNRFEKRGLLKAKIMIPNLDKEITLANTHLNLTQMGRNKQSQMIIESMKNHHNESWVLVGDFNDWNKKLCAQIESTLGAQEVFKTMNGKLSATFPSFMPILSLDRFFTHNVRGISAKVLTDEHWKSLSDHLPLLVEIEID